METKADVSATVLRAMRILHYLKETPGPQSVSYISKALDLSPSIVHRLLATLKTEGFVFQDLQSKQYSLGAAFLEYANKLLTDLPFAPIIEPWLLHLRRTTEETAGFYIPSGNARLCVMEYESHQEIRRSVGVGTQHPIHAGATGRAILAYQPEEIQERMLQQLPLDDRDELMQKLQATRDYGYAISFEEINTNVSALSAPVFEQQQVVGAVSISGPTFRFNEALVKKHIPTLTEATNRISNSFM